MTEVEKVAAQIRAISTALNETKRPAFAKRRQGVKVLK